ncbi:MAG: 30S ribosomal protein S6 [Candidatus Brennerbacteria bacterium]
MDEKQHNTYEIAFYTKEENSAPVKSVVAAHHGEVTKEKPFEKVRFEFKIAKESFAFFGALHVSLPPEDVAPLSRALSLAPGVIRFLITKSVSPTEGRGEERKPVERKRPALPRMVPQESSVLTNEAIEKKIEEILQ